MLTISGKLIIKSLKKISITVIIIFFTSTLNGQNLVENFETNPEKRWQFFTDRVMGGQSSGKLEFWKDDEKSFARMIGDVTTKNNGGFIQFRAKLGDPLNPSTKGIKINVRGNNQKYFIHIRTSGTLLPWQYYSQSFDANENWNTIDLPFSSFQASGSFMRKKLNPSVIRTLGIVAYGRDHQAEIEVSDIIFY